MTDREFVFALEKYKLQLEMDVPNAEDIDEIIRQGMNLDTILKEEDNGEEY